MRAIESSISQRTSFADAVQKLKDRAVRYGQLVIYFTVLVGLFFIYNALLRYLDAFLERYIPGSIPE